MVNIKGKICGASDCNRKHHAKGFCMMHYKRFKSQSLKEDNNKKDAPAVAVTQNKSTRGNVALISRFKNINGKEPSPESVRDLVKKFPWIKKADFRDAKVLVSDSGDLIWEGGTWIRGVWMDGIWKNGVWENGVWKSGIWEGGTWDFGTWEFGVWRSGEWINGEWCEGYAGGKYYDLDDSPHKFLKKFPASK